MQQGQPGQNASRFELAEAGREHVRRHSKVALQISIALRSAEQPLHYEQGPPRSDDIEGRGKVAMSRLLADDSDLGDERSYLTRTVPAGVVQGLTTAVRGEPSAAARSAAMVTGLAAAGAGAAVELATGAIERGRARRARR